MKKNQTQFVGAVLVAAPFVAVVVASIVAGGWPAVALWLGVFAFLGCVAGGLTLLDE